MAMKARGASVAVWLAALTILGVAGFFLAMPFFVGCYPSPNAHCLSNQKQLVQALLIYSEDQDGRLPNRDAWMDAAATRSKWDSLFHCPALWKESDKSPHLHGYAFDGRLSGARVGEVATPEDTPVLYDSVNLAKNASDLRSSLPEPPRHGTGDKPKNVLAFLDGHARAMTNSDIAAIPAPHSVKTHPY
jgi:hypothetical protein